MDNELKEFCDILESTQIIYPKGMFGPEKDYLIDSVIRAISEFHGDESEWPSKYGTRIDNDILMIHPFCWCEMEDCPWCREMDALPNFHYKPLDFKATWYKYIGRDMQYNKEISAIDCARMLVDCMKTYEN
jgi:hypothetical protein